MLYIREELFFTGDVFSPDFLEIILKRQIANDDIITIKASDNSGMNEMNVKIYLPL